MAKLDENRRKSLKMAIHQHLSLVGPGDWDKLMNEWRDVPRSTFFRIIKEVRDEITAGAAAAESPEALRVAQARVRAVAEPLANIQHETARHIPATPSPALIARDGMRGARNIDFIGRFESLYSDAEMQRSAAMAVDPDTGRERIKNPMMFANSVKLRCSILEAEMRALEGAFNFEGLQELYSIIIEEIGKESPELQHRILVRLRNLNNIRGMTVAANI